MPGPQRHNIEFSKPELRAIERACGMAIDKDDSDGDGADPYMVGARKAIAKVLASLGAVLVAVVMAASMASTAEAKPVRAVAKELIKDRFVRCPVLLTDLQEYGVPPVFTLFRVRYERRYGPYAGYPRPWPAFRAVTNECLRRAGVGGSGIR